jgi:hypothetical protein
MQNRPDVFEEHLVSILTNAVRHSPGAVVFQAAMHAVEILPGRIAEDARAGHTVRRNARNTVVDRDWQGLKIGATRRGNHDSSKLLTAFENRGGVTIWTTNFSYGNEQTADDFHREGSLAVRCRGEGPANLMCWSDRGFPLSAHKSA